MAHKSLLDLEEARQRLEMLNVEQGELSDLIQKLKQIRDVMTTLQSETEKQKSETEKWLANIEKTAKDTTSKATETNKAFSDSLQSFEQKADSLSDNLADETSQLRGELETQFEKFRDEQVERLDQASKSYERMLEELTGEASQLRNELETQFEKFRDEQTVSLDQVSRSYERMRVAYDTIRDTTSSLETSVEDILKRLQCVEEKQKTFEDSINSDLEQKYSVLKDVKKEMEIVKWKNANIQQQFDGLREVLAEQTDRALGEHTDAMTTIIEELRTELNHKENTYARKLRSIWIVIVFALLLSGIAAAVLVIRYFT